MSATHGRGFTLVELMIALVLLAVLLSIAAPSFRSLMADQRLRAVSSDLRIALNTARSEAVKRNRQVTLVAQGGATTQDWSRGWVIDSPVVDDPPLLEHAQGGAITVAGPVSVSFSPAGRSNGAREWEIRTTGDGAVSSCLIMSADGRARSEKGDCP